MRCRPRLLLAALLSLSAPAFAERALISAADATSQEGKVATVRGRIIEVRRVADGPIIFEFDGKPGAPAFRALVYPMAVPRFGSTPETNYLGRFVEVTGAIVVRKNLPQAWINDPSALRLAEPDSPVGAQR